ncbi:hypothetical protein FJT64_000179 [Amphibalanus amphitrite]|uniref:Uncharacterized protein n=1 Tax=Amphibalanus amphitrite TaxID=1232801 RepID=A0A6A4VA86_AMPAM|nr:hypothetical protein FJT64_000179 [Amphibalanus amphitrite]
MPLELLSVDQWRAAGWYPVESLRKWSDGLWTSDKQLRHGDSRRLEHGRGRQLEHGRPRGWRLEHSRGRRLEHGRGRGVLTADLPSLGRQPGAPRVRVRVEAYYSADVDALPDTGADISVGGIQFLDDMNEFPENLLPPNEHPKAADGATVKSIGVLPHSAADALSRNPIEHPNEDDECGEDATTSCIQSIVISELKAHDVDISLKEVREAAAADHEFQLLAEVIRNGFPDSPRNTQ